MCLQETRRSFLEFHFTDLLSVAFLAWSMLGLSFLVPFSLFHVSALLCNVTSKNACGHRRISLQSRRMNLLAEYNQIFCGPLQPLRIEMNSMERSGSDHARTASWNPLSWMSPERLDFRRIQPPNLKLRAK